jgi:hypothetical protein
LFDMTKRFHEHVPPHLRPRTRCTRHRRTRPWQPLQSRTPQPPRRRCRQTTAGHGSRLLAH